MVAVSKQRRQTPWMACLPTFVYPFLGFLLLVHIFDDDHPSGIHHLGPEPVNYGLSKAKPDATLQCPGTSISALTPEERNPQKGPRHMVTPPEGGPLHLVCCTTTKGPLNILVHEKWAPNGAQQFVKMVQTGYFSSTVPMMRCLKNFLCQFGLNADPERSKEFQKRLVDDPNWLPEGKANRKNEDLVKRFSRGYLAYAGGGNDSRNNQFIVSLNDVETLAGGSPWEVPWGELVGSHSFETLSKIYTGYGEKGPPQGKLMTQGMTDDMKREFPDLDYITSCTVVDQSDS